jgi:hypothetical protein
MAGAERVIFEFGATGKVRDSANLTNSVHLGFAGSVANFRLDMQDP